ncbi:MAG: slipin family protein [Thermoplasmata archaeon]|nr:MAG: slipin family protein [Thermoplasmata archaeon]
MSDAVCALGIFILLLFLVILLLSAIRVVREYERLVIFRVGRLKGQKGPGIVFVFPIIDRAMKIDLRIQVADVPKQRIITRDNVTVDVDAVVYYRVYDPEKAVTKVQRYDIATNLLAQTTLRDVLGQVELDDLLSRREELNKRLQEIIDINTDPWGVKVSAVTIRDVALPEAMLRAMAKQAEAERERRSRIIMAEGEYQASMKMAEAAKFYQDNPAAMKLRELQTLAEIAREKNLIVVAPSTSFESLSTVLAVAKGVREGKHVE